VLNASDEVAVEAFLDGKIGFTEIPEIVDRCLEELPGGPASHFEELFETDERARQHARNLVEGQAVA
jgi:1-deoxy-D-xylulose-5-phosphate reductoisomerase